MLRARLLGRRNEMLVRTFCKAHSIRQIIITTTTFGALVCVPPSVKEFAYFINIIINCIEI